MTEIIAERIIKAAKELISKGVIPFTRKDLGEMLPEIKHGSLNPIFQSMVKNARGGPYRVPKYYKKYFWRLERGKYVLLWVPD